MSQLQQHQRISKGESSRTIGSVGGRSKTRLLSSQRDMIPLSAEPMMSDTLKQFGDIDVTQPLPSGKHRESRALRNAKKYGSKRRIDGYDSNMGSHFGSASEVSASECDSASWNDRSIEPSGWETTCSTDIADSESASHTNLNDIIQKIRYQEQLLRADCESFYRSKIRVLLEQLASESLLRTHFEKKLEAQIKQSSGTSRHFTIEVEVDQKSCNEEEEIQQRHLEIHDSLLLLYEEDSKNNKLVSFMIMSPKALILSSKTDELHISCRKTNVTWRIFSDNRVSVFEAISSSLKQWSDKTRTPNYEDKEFAHAICLLQKEGFSQQLIEDSSLSQHERDKLAEFHQQLALSHDNVADILESYSYTNKALLSIVVKLLAHSSNHHMKETKE